MTDDASRKAILARRAKFVAAAIAGMGIACGKEPSKPHVCLSVEATAIPDAQSQPPSSGDAGAGAAPAPCLSIAPEAADGGNLPPRVCLRMIPPKGSK